MWIDVKDRIYPEDKQAVLVQIGYKYDSEGDINNYDVSVALYDSERMAFTPHGVYCKTGCVEFLDEVIAWKEIK